MARSSQSLEAVWKSRWPSWAPVPNKPTVSVDVKQHSTKARSWLSPASAIFAVTQLFWPITVSVIKAELCKSIVHCWRDQRLTLYSQSSISMTRTSLQSEQCHVSMTRTYLSVVRTVSCQYDQNLSLFSQNSVMSIWPEPSLCSQNSVNMTRTFLSVVKTVSIWPEPFSL